MASLSAFLPYLLPHVPGCSDPYAIQALRTACIDFCHTTLLFQEVSVYTVNQNASEVELDVPTSAVLSKVMAVFWEEQPLHPKTVESVTSASAIRGDAPSGTPVAFYQKTPTSAEISIYPAPSESKLNALAVRAAFAPSRSSQSVPDFLLEDWVEEIACGAAFRLMLTPEQPFSNPTLAAAQKSMFDDGVRRGLIQARHGLVTAASRVRHVPFA